MASAQDARAAATAARAEAQPGSILVVVHNFRARSRDELSLNKGDRIELIERDDEFNDGWFLGRHLSTGETGLFPEVYTTPAPKSSFLSSAPRRTSGSMLNAVQAHDVYSLQRPASAATAPTHQRVGSGNSLYTKSPSTNSRSSLPTTTESKPLNPAATQSPVMHETLTVIDEHMNDLNPHHARSQPRRDTMSSMYSSYPNHRMSYIAGHETEDEEGGSHSEAEVMSWTPDQVAEYLEDHGVERSHCQVFREQEITGEVLLAMDQSSLFMKEFDLGPVGRRLRTWHKVKALQEETRKTHDPAAVLNPQTTIGAVELPADEIIRSRSTSAVSTLAQAPAPLRNSGGPQAFAPSGPAMSPILSRSNSSHSPAIGLATTTDTSYRPSAQNIRTMQHWRHSSVDSTTNSGDNQLGHRKQSSIDRYSHASGRVPQHQHNTSTDTMPYNHREGLFTSPVQSSPNDFEKGYFSSNEVDSRTRRGKVLQKRQNSASASSAHSRNGSFIMYGSKGTPSARDASTDSLQDQIVSSTYSPAPPQGNFFKAGASRTISMPTYGNKVMSPLNESGPPVVTKLEHNTSPSAGTANSPIPASSESPSSASTPHTSSMHLPFFSKTSKIPGMRAISDAVTRSEKTSAANANNSATSKQGEMSSPVKDGASTLSTGMASVDEKSGPRTSAGSATGLVPQPAPRKRPARTKKATSAYTRGLEKKTPAEQMAGCDYSGWMKKKSGSLMSAWKPRLFVLRGRRLSYYYSADDTEEKGLIDISFHNVMPAMDEKLVNMHAAVTGASGAGTPTSPQTDASLMTSAQQDLMDNPPGADSHDDNLFIFKLTPPKSGRGVNFTKPTVHYFAVNSRQEGRLWMAALMKAVINRDHEGVVTTTFNQKTISLSKARADRARPPAFQEDSGPVTLDKFADSEEKGLGIGVESPRVNGVSVLGGADGNERAYPMEDGSSVAPSTVPTTAPSVRTNMSFDIEKDQLTKTGQ